MFDEILRLFVSKFTDVFVKRRDVRTNSLFFTTDTNFSTAGYANGKVKALAFTNLGASDVTIYNGKVLQAVVAPSVPETFSISSGFGNNFYINDNINIQFVGGTGYLQVLVMSEI